MDDEGSIKFHGTWIKAEPIKSGRLTDLQTWRNRLYQLGLIGSYTNGIGFGNISIRINNTEQFIITGSATGVLSSLTPHHYTTVLSVAVEKNTLTCKGPCKASSESLTHAMIYHAYPTIGGVIHVHNHTAWQQLLDKIPTTAKDVSYGTPAMAHEITRLFRETDVREKKILVMGGHTEGIISFGRDLDEAGKILLENLY